MMKLKKSQYNYFVRHNDKFIIYNMKSGSIGTMDNDVYDRFITNSLTEDEIETCKRKGLLIDEDYDEKAVMEKDRAEGIHKKDGKNFRIWPTSACNARCYYCFEKGIKYENMSEETAEHVVGFIASQIEEGDTFVVEWFGGEPLLKITTMEFITERLQGICRERNCHANYRMISNGSLIDEVMADRIKTNCFINYVQITLDGYGREYEIIKNYVNPQMYGFERVISGIRLLKERGIHVGIRMNYDTKNFNTLCQLIDYLHKEFTEYEDIKYYVYPVWTSVLDNDDTFVSEAEADRQYLELLKRIYGHGMNSLRQLARLGYRKYQCHACHESGFSIYPDGSIGKCDEIFTQKIGDIKQGIIDLETYNYWTKQGVDEKCDKCVFLPMCQGGCRSSRFNNMPQCFAHRKILPDLLKWYVDAMAEKRRKEG